MSFKKYWEERGYTSDPLVVQHYYNTESVDQLYANHLVDTHSFQKMDYNTHPFHLEAPVVTTLPIIEKRVQREGEQIMYRRIAVDQNTMDLLAEFRDQDFQEIGQLKFQYELQRKDLSLLRRSLLEASWTQRLKWLINGWRATFPKMQG